MAGAVFQIVSGSQTTLPQVLATASLDGWVLLQPLAVSGNVFFSLLGRGSGVFIPLTQETQSLPSSIPAGSGSLGMWQTVFPPATAPGTLDGINTDPNKISVRGG